MTSTSPASMRRARAGLAAIAAGLLWAAPVVAQSGECAEPVVRMRTLQTKYRGAVGEMRSARIDFVQPSTDPETQLRSHRRYTQLMRDLSDLRGRILETYRTLADAGCAPYDAEGLAQTASEFQRVAAEDQALLTSQGRSALRMP